MRARHRHIHAGSMGAKMHLDARYLSGFSDGNAVGTWTDRTASANNMTQGTASLKPLYKTGIIGGQPVVRFDVTDDVLKAGSSMNWGNITKSSGVTLFVVAKSADNTDRDGFGWSNLTTYTPIYHNTIFMRGSNAGSGAWFGANYDGSEHRAWAAATNNAAVLLCKIGATTNYTVQNGTTTSAATGSPSINNSAGLWLGKFYWGCNMDFAAAGVYEGYLSDTLTKRLGHAMAYSFKIAC